MFKKLESSAKKFNFEIKWVFGNYLNLIEKGLKIPLLGKNRPNSEKTIFNKILTKKKSENWNWIRTSCTSKKCCGICKGKLELKPKKSDNMNPDTPANINPFADFVKKHYKREANQTHSDAMQILSEKWKQIKLKFMVI